MLHHRITGPISSPEAKTEDFLLSLSVVLFSGRSRTVDWAGLIPARLSEGSEARVPGNSVRISSDLFFDRSFDGGAIVALKKVFHNPDGPLYKVPRTVTFGEPAEATAEVSR